MKMLTKFIIERPNLNRPHEMQTLVFQSYSLEYQQQSESHQALKQVQDMVDSQIQTLIETTLSEKEMEIYQALEQRIQSEGFMSSAPKEQKQYIAYFARTHAGFTKKDAQAYAVLYCKKPRSPEEQKTYSYLNARFCGLTDSDAQQYAQLSAKVLNSGMQVLPIEEQERLLQFGAQMVHFPSSLQTDLITSHRRNVIEESPPNNNYQDFNTTIGLLHQSWDSPWSLSQESRLRVGKLLTHIEGFQ